MLEWETDVGKTKTIEKEGSKMNIFDILGPVMVGPSSSHTAGAARIGLMTRKLLGAEPVEADIRMYGSFAATGKGHGTCHSLIISSRCGFRRALPSRKKKA